MKKISLVIIISISLTGCFAKEGIEKMPTVNDENCKFENIKKIKDKKTREKFSALCLRR